MAWVYILGCADDSFYVGSTLDLDERLARHQAGHGSNYTSRRLPVTLLWAAEYERVDEAWEMERRLHGWGRAKRQALIDGDYQALPRLSARPSRRGRG